MPLSLLPYVVVLALGIFGLAVSAWQGYKWGRDSRASEVAELRVAIDASRSEADRAKARAGQVTERVSVEYRDRIRVIREKAPPPEVIERVRIESANCPIVPPSLVCLWNGESAPGGLCAESAPGDAVTLAQLAEVAAEARSRFLENQAKLDGLQRWAREVSQ